MISLRQVPRLLRIAGVLARYRLDELLPPARRPRALAWLRAAATRPPAHVLALPRGERLVIAYDFLQSLRVRAEMGLPTRK